MVLLPDENGTGFIIIIHHIPPFANSKNLRHTLCRRQTVKKPPGGVGGPAGPLTVIVSGGFAAGAGRFRLSAENIPYTEERPGGPFRPDQRRSAILEKVPNALFRHAERPERSGRGDEAVDNIPPADQALLAGAAGLLLSEWELW